MSHVDCIGSTIKKGTELTIGNSAFLVAVVTLSAVIVVSFNGEPRDRNAIEPGVCSSRCRYWLCRRRSNSLKSRGVCSASRSALLRCL
jgi:hypothetical protein